MNPSEENVVLKEKLGEEKIAFQALVFLAVFGLFFSIGLLKSIDAMLESSKAEEELSGINGRIYQALLDRVRFNQPVSLNELGKLFGPKGDLDHYEKQIFWKPFKGAVASVRGKTIRAGEGFFGAPYIELNVPEVGDMKLTFSRSYGDAVKAVRPGTRIKASGFLKADIMDGLKNSRLE